MCKDGRRVWMEWTNSGVYDSQGCLQEFLSVGIDTTDRKRAERDVERFENPDELQSFLSFPER